MKIPLPYRAAFALCLTLTVTIGSVKAKELPSQSATLNYSEEKVIAADPPSNCSGGGGILGALEGVTCQMDNVGKTTEDKVEVATATQVLELTPVILEPESGNSYRLALKVRGGSVQFDGKLQERAISYVNADSRLVKSRLARWTSTFNSDQVAALKAGNSVEMSVSRPFEGLQRLSLTEAVTVVIEPPLPGVPFHTDIEPMLRWVAKGDNWLSPQTESD